VARAPDKNLLAASLNSGAKSMFRALANFAAVMNEMLTSPERTFVT